MGLVDCADFAWIGDKIAFFNSKPRNPSPQNRRGASYFDAKVFLLLPYDRYEASSNPAAVKTTTNRLVTARARNSAK